MSLEVVLQRFQPVTHAPTLKQCQQYIAATLLYANKDISEGEITIRIIDQAESAHLNKTYRHKEGPTNVLSFDYDVTDHTFTGDLAICADVVEQEATIQHKSLESHWAHMIIHGTLHLLGYDHETDSDADVMETLEIQIMAGLGFLSPY